MKKKILYGVLGTLAVLFLIGVFAGNDEQTSATQNDSVDTTAVVETVQSTSPWSYFTDTDEMTDAETYYATVESENEVEFEFPYNGGSTLGLTLRKSPKFGTDVYIKISKGQFMSSISGVPVSLRIDSEKAFKTTANGASDGSSDVLFLSNAKSLIKKLKTAKTLKVEVEFFQEGYRTFTFNVEGLEWEH